MNIETFRRLKAGDRIVIACSSMGADGNDEERTHPEGSTGLVSSVRDLGNEQGYQVTVLIGDGDKQIDNRWDETDDLGLLERAEPRMSITLSQIREIYRAGKHKKSLADAVHDIVNGGSGFHVSLVPRGSLESMLEDVDNRTGLAQLARI